MTQLKRTCIKSILIVFCMMCVDVFAAGCTRRTSDSPNRNPESLSESDVLHFRKIASNRYAWASGDNTEHVVLTMNKGKVYGVQYLNDHEGSRRHGISLMVDGETRQPTDIEVLDSLVYIYHLRDGKLLPEYDTPKRKQLDSAVQKLNFDSL